MHLKLLCLLSMPLLLAAPAPSASACIHVPRTYKGAVTEKTKEALLFHDGVNAHLIIRTNLSAASGKLPGMIAWVIPLPSLPSHYEEADPALFPELFRVTERAREESESHLRGMKTAGIPLAKAIVVHPAQTIGSYQVQPVEILDPKNAGRELNRWLLANGFGSAPVQNQQYYLRRGAVFLCLKIHGLSGGFSDIKPLHIIYKSDTLAMPLKFSTHSGAFNVELYVFTPHAINPRLLAASGLSGDTSVAIQSASDAARLWQIAGGHSGFLTRFEGYGYNSSGLMVKDLKADPAIDLRRNNAPPLSLAATLPAGGLGAAMVAAVVLGAALRRRKHRLYPAGA